MAFSFRESPAIVQVIVYVVVGAAVFAGGEYVPGSPIQQVRTDKEKAEKDRASLQQEVQALQVYERQSSQLRAEIEANQKQLETLKQIVPDDKQVDEFIRALNDSAKASNVSLRSLSAKPIEPKDYFYEVPFDVKVDGPYFQVLDFFSRLSNLSRIINIGDVEFSSPDGRSFGNYPLRPGTTILMQFVATTYFTGGAAGPPKPAPKPGGRR
jgi:type IV pilus assembly protein PilO